MADEPGMGFGLSDILWFLSDINRIVSDKIWTMSDIGLTLSDIFSFLSDNQKTTGPELQVGRGDRSLVPGKQRSLGDEDHFGQRIESKSSS